MGGLIPLTDASRRPVSFPIVTISIIVINFVVFGQELKGGETFVLKWAAIPANITASHNWITILTAMFTTAVGPSFWETWFSCGRLDRRWKTP